MRRSVLAFAGAVAVLALQAGPAIAADDKDCADFATQAEAVAALAGGDPYQLDADDDGVPCETQFGSALQAGAESSSSASPEQLPRTGPQEELALAGGLLVVGGAGLMLLGRKRRVGRHVLQS